MKFPTFIAAFLLAVVALSISTVSADMHRTHESVERTRPADTEEPQSPRGEESPERDTEDEEEPQGGVVYDKNGIMVFVDENGDTTVVTVMVNGGIASKVTHIGSGDSNTGGNNSGEDSEPGEDGEDGEDGNDSGSDPDPEEETGGRTDRPEHTR